MPAGFEGSIKARETELLPIYRQVLHLRSSGWYLVLLQRLCQTCKCSAILLCEVV